MNSQKTKFMVANANSMITKLSELLEIITTNKPLVIAITETWLTRHIPDAEVGTPGFQILRQERGPAVKAEGFFYM